MILDSTLTQHQTTLAILVQNKELEKKKNIHILGKQ